ncbi:S8 family serine peptidase [Truepera radiovictrix]|uniref:Peptidase S8 and S53 subtilisin kexin sedolisin n=1 Tax=Truepera radiovictrix (strain DSM 17093 / CIP 108686 / LMG 22925 / RQ-24) TaxID=649638 RepID=D7CRV4_TRURR|nr:S8 family serine peptidase [Truepera radiovictrix]ADI15282.1 peptidase S8 and S53 subtilisin kexin sedolisin [Truepera radiovictrix DSM 17093]WMT56167.1 S8 family serine peptidase [Truepera radiovictrix]
MMRRPLALASLCLLLGACNLLPPPTSPLSDKCFDETERTLAPAAQLARGAPDAAFVPGRLLVRYRDGDQGDLGRAPIGRGLGQPPLTAQARLQGLARDVQRDYGLQPLAGAGAPQVGVPDLVAVPEGADVLELAERLSADPRVAYAEPDYYLYPLGLTSAALPNDPLLHEQWHLLDFGLPQAWALETGKSDIVLAVLDSGVDLAHEDLAGRILPGCDVYNEDNDPSPGSPAQLGANQRHGTHVAGIALASGDNGVGVAGVAYTGVRLLPVKVFDDSGRDTQRTATSVVARAIRWSAGLSVEGMNRNPNPAHIINLSLGGRGTVQTLNDAVADARRAGTLVIAASGNSESDDAIYAPANAPGAIAVGSVDQSGRRSYFSNYSRAGRSVDLMAPGGMGNNACGAIFSTLSPAYEGATESAYGCEQGTSMAAPFVAGVAALVWSQNPELSRAEVEARLLSSTLFTDEMNPAEYGAGILCADRALGADTLCGK